MSEPVPNMGKVKAARLLSNPRPSRSRLSTLTPKSVASPSAEAGRRSLLKRACCSPHLSPPLLQAVSSASSRGVTDDTFDVSRLAHLVSRADIDGRAWVEGSGTAQPPLQAQRTGSWVRAARHFPSQRRNRRCRACSGTTGRFGKRPVRVIHHPCAIRHWLCHQPLLRADHMSHLGYLHLHSTQERPLVKGECGLLSRADRPRARIVCLRGESAQQE